MSVVEDPVTGVPGVSGAACQRRGCAGAAVAGGRRRGEDRHSGRSGAGADWWRAAGQPTLSVRP